MYKIMFPRSECISTYHLIYELQLRVKTIGMLRESVMSGKAGGFLALDWNDTTPVGPLARLSFKLHQELAKTLSDNYGYRQMDTLRVATSEEHQPLSRIQPQSVPAWVDRGVSRVQVDLFCSPGPCQKCPPGEVK